MDDRPFLTVITRTLGHRFTLIDTLTCLAAQDDAGFEVRLMVNTDDDEAHQRCLALVETFDESFRSSVHVHVVAELHRVRPLNIGLDAARGRYVTVLDDDDLVFAHWVAQFRSAGVADDGRVLRCRAVDQAVDALGATDALGTGIRASATSGFLQTYRPTFDLASHLVGGQSPQGSVAFPVDEIRELGLRFDEDMEVCEDLDFLLRAATRLGVVDTGTFAMVYRRWNERFASSHSIPPDVWEASLQRIVAQLDEQSILMPPGTASRLYQAAVQERQMNMLDEGESGLLRRAELAERRAASLAHQYAELERSYRELEFHRPDPTPRRSPRLRPVTSRVAGALRRSRPDVT